MPCFTNSINVAVSKLHRTANQFLKGAERGCKIGGWLECHGPFLLNKSHDLDQRLLCIGHQEKGAGGRGSLHTGVTMDEDGMTCLVFAHDFNGNLRSPHLHVADFRGLQIIIHGYTVLIGDGRMKWDLFRTVEDGLDIVTLQPIAVQGHFPSPNPDTGYDLIYIFTVFPIVHHYRGGRKRCGVTDRI